MKLLRSYLFALWGSGRSIGTVGVWPLRIAIGVALPTLGAYFGDWSGYARLGAGFGFMLGFIWILFLDSGEGKAATVLNLAGLAFTVGYIYLKVYREPPDTHFSPTDLVPPFAAFLSIFDALGVYPQMRFDLDHNMARFCPNCGRGLRWDAQSRFLTKTMAGGG